MWIFFVLSIYTNMYTGTMHALQGFIYSVMEKNMTKKWKKRLTSLIQIQVLRTYQLIKCRLYWFKIWDVFFYILCINQISWTSRYQNNVYLSSFKCYCPHVIYSHEKTSISCWYWTGYSGIIKPQLFVFLLIQVTVCFTAVQKKISFQIVEIIVCLVKLSFLSLQSKTCLIGWPRSEWEVT